jgi:L-2-hydroxyglutarate oxidase LhgO
VEYVDGKNDYWIGMPGSDAELGRRRRFWDSVATYLQLGDRQRDWDRMQPDYAGLRPKLRHPTHADGFRDFIIEDMRNEGFPGFINLVGIESPGLTASLAIAEYVDGLLMEHSALNA